jgi:predicted transcriptional regulator of viral defense system
LDRVLTVLQELGEVMEPKKLDEAIKADGITAYAQRLGFLLEKAGFSDLAARLSKWVEEKNPSLARLEPSMPIRGSRKDGRWKILVNTDVEGDL